MKYRLILIVFFSIIRLYGQIEIDTIAFEKIVLKDVQTLSESGMSIIDTLSHPRAYVLSGDTVPEALAIKKRRGMLIFDLLPESSYGTVLKLERKQVNGKGYKELIVYCDDTYGHSGLGGGIRQTNRRIVIYDLKKMAKIFDELYFDSNYQWTNELSDDLEVTSTSEYFECFNFEIEIKNKRIIFELKENESCDTIDFSDFIATTWEYEIYSNNYISKAYPMSKE